MAEATGNLFGREFFPRRESPRVLPMWGLWLATVCLFLPVHSPNDKVLELRAWLMTQAPGTFDWLPGHVGIARTKAVLFLVGLVVCAIPIIRDVVAARWVREAKTIVVCGGIGILVTAVVAALLIPYHGSSGPASMGQLYGHVSVSPFTEDSGVLYRRLGLPALAYFSGMRGPSAYYLWVAATGFATIFLTTVLCRRLLSLSDLGPRHSNLRLFILTLSLSTTGFWVFQFQLPGYVEPFAFALLLVVALTPTTEGSRLAAVSVCLATHEAMLFVLIPIAIFIFSKRELIYAAVAHGLYGLLWLVTSAFSLSEVFDAHSVEDKPVFEFLLRRPGLALLGVFFAYKLLWVPIVAVVVRQFRNGRLRQGIALTAFLALPLLLVPIAVDTSRMVAFGSIGALLALSVAARTGMMRRTWFWVLVGANILVPSYYVGLNTGAALHRGLYQMLLVRFGLA